MEAAAASKNFVDIKASLEDLVQGQVNKHFADYKYDSSNAQEKSNQVAESIVKEAQQVVGKNFKL